MCIIDSPWRRCLAFTNGIDFTIDAAGSIAADGLIDEAGGTDSDFFAGDAAERCVKLLFSSRLPADVAGTFIVSADFADDIAKIVRFFDQPTAVPLGQHRIHRRDD